MTLLLCIIAATVWLILGWLALEGDITAPSEFIWLLFYGVPSIVLIVFGLGLIYINKND